jgi:hypothetical protein
VYGGRQETVVQAGVIERLTLYVRVGAPGLLAAFGAVLLLSGPGAQLPPGWGIGPVAAGWLCLGAAPVLAAGTWAWRALRRRREAVWESARVLDRAAADVAEALLRRYEHDERLRQAGDPRMLDVLWRGPGDEAGTHGGSVVDAFEDPGAVPDRRLVVLGAAGAGKSVLVLRLARDLLRRGAARGEAVPVPVVVPLAAWNTRQGLESWAAGQLAADHPEACTPVPGAPPERVAAHLVDTERVLLVLDGFDELPQAARKAAFDDLLALPASRPFVLTSRPEEYAEQIPVDSDFLRTEIRLEPLSARAIGDYLSAGGRRARWRNVVGRLIEAEVEADRSSEGRMLLRALDVPLMVGLARAAYGGHGADRHPDELIEPGRFGAAEELRGHLYAAYLDAVYSASRSRRELHGGSSSEEARKWAGFLAARMRAAGRTQFAWWHLDREVPWWVRTLGLVPAVVGIGVVLGLAGFGEPWWRSGVDVSLLGGYAVVAALALGSAGVAGAQGRDRWLTPPYLLAGLSVRRLRAAFRKRATWWGWGLVGGVLLAGWWAVLRGGSASSVLVMALLSAGALLAAARRLTGAVWRPADTALAGSPAGLLRADRRGVLVMGMFAPLRHELIGGAYLLVLPAPMLLWWQLHGVGRHHVSVRDWVVVVGGSLLSTLLYNVAVSAWGRYTVARLALAAAGKVPWRFMEFLHDAHRRGVLRQSGGFYEFRHIELRDRLAEDASAGDTGRDGGRGGRRGSVADGRRARVLSGVLSVWEVGALLVGSSVVGMTPALPVRKLPEACALLGARELRQLTSDGVEHGYDALLGTACAAAEQSPFAPEVRIRITTALYGSDQRRNGVQSAAYVLDAVARDARRSGDAEVRRLDGLGDEAYAVMERKHYLQLSEFMEVAPPRARLFARYGNATITVEYAEEFATEKRTAAVAEILFRKALRAAGPQWITDAAGADGLLSDLPKTRIPNRTPHRFASYHREWQESVHGATWKGRERSYLWLQPGFPFAFRAPKWIVCTYAAGSADVKTDGLTVRACRPREESETLGVTPPDLRIDLALLSCGPSCDREEAGVVLRSGRESRSRGLDRKQTDGSSWYAVREDAGKDGRRYEMLLWRHFGYQDDGGKRHAFLLWAAVETAEKEKELAQKIVNDIFTQTGGNRKGPAV